MGWTSDEEVTTKKGMETSTKILIAIIACVVLIITLILVLLLNIQTNTFNLSIDAKATNYDINRLIAQIDDVTYINIEEFAKLVGYEYHGGEYKSFTLEDGKCYVQGSEETATFFANDNKVCKLPLNQLQEEYREYTVENTIKIKNNKMYAPIEAISIAFNVSIGEDINSLTIYTLDYLVKYYNDKVIKAGYSDITEQSFENKKAILYGYLIVNKENGLYKILDENNNSKEIVPDKYRAIEFSENTQEFLVTNSLGQVGIINLDGTTKIEPTYDSISILDKSSGLYLIQKNEKYGVVKSGNVIVISPEYDNIGLTNISSNSILENKYFLLDKLIPVSQKNKWGAFDKNGKLILKLEYDGFGCNNTSVVINDTEKAVEPVTTIERCNGIVVQKEGKYGVIDLTGKEMVPIAVESIYGVENVEDEDSKYFMIYNGERLNVIERLIIAGFVKPKEEEKEKEEQEENNIITVDITNTTTNQSSNNSVN